eukprot:12738569-Alexandrium_andersonii.AAC.1
MVQAAKRQPPEGSQLSPAAKAKASPAPPLRQTQLAFHTSPPQQASFASGQDAAPEQVAAPEKSAPEQPSVPVQGAASS